jgi:polyhydroxyalkanoate synthase
MNHVAGPKRFVRSSSGHILGIVNPPVEPPKRDYLAGSAERHDTVDSWRANAEEQAGSWWPDWMTWLAPHAGPLRAPPAVSSRSHPALADAPGTYVLER